MIVILIHGDNFKILAILCDSKPDLKLHSLRKLDVLGRLPVVLVVYFLPPLIQQYLSS